jgi:hypothetical protein
MSQHNQASGPWHKSTYSAGANNCVEVAEGLATAVRDTQHRELGTLTFPAREWQAFLGVAKD